MEHRSGDAVATLAPIELNQGGVPPGLIVEFIELLECWDGQEAARLIPAHPG